MGCDFKSPVACPPGTDSCYFQDTKHGSSARAQNRQVNLFAP